MPLSRPTAVGLASLVVAFGAAGVAVCTAQTASPASVESAVPAAPTETDSWTAKILQPVAARTAPSATAPVRTRLMHFTAFSRRDNVLMVTGYSPASASGDAWVRVQLPVRPNGTSAWVPASMVQVSRIRTRLRVRLASRTVEYLRDGVTVQRFAAAVGTAGTPTPTGLFAVQDPVQSSGSQRSYLGPYIITLTAFSPVLTSFMGGDGLIAIHGTNAPGLMRRAVSHGCVRVTNSSSAALWGLVSPGMPVEITSS